MTEEAPAPTDFYQGGALDPIPVTSVFHLAKILRVPVVRAKYSLESKELTACGYSETHTFFRRGDLMLYRLKYMSECATW